MLAPVRFRFPLLGALLVLSLPLATTAQEAARKAESQATAIDPVDAVFYRAFYVDRGLEDKSRALQLYQAFLQRAPTNPLAGQAARNAIAILRKLERAAEADALAKKHDKILSETVPAGINAKFLDPGADVARFVQTFESESREVFKHRQDIVDLLGLKPGQAIADIGAGTGVFTNLFARAVGETGKVYAVDISPVMVHHLSQLRARMNLPQVEVVRCTDSSTKLPEDCADVAFICDTYHHFNHPQATLASIHRALREGGELVLIDFERIPGKTRSWILGHVRAGENVFSSEIEAAGFERIGRAKTPFLTENYLVRFRRR